MSDLATVLAVSFVAGAATGIGALPTLFTERISHRIYDGALGFAAGVMIGASVFTLVLPGLEFGTMPEVIVGILVGGLFLLGANRLVPHVHYWFGGERQHGDSTELDDALDEEATIERADGSGPLRHAALIGAAITIHNIPEGLAVGIAFASGLDGVGLTIAIAIGIQNVPDGFAMAVPAAQGGVSKFKTVLYTVASAAIPEPVAALVGFLSVSVVTELFPVAAGLAAGAMMAVVFREIVPSSHGHGYADSSTLTFVAGFALMMFIDTTFAV